MAMENWRSPFRQARVSSEKMQDYLRSEDFGTMAALQFRPQFD